MNQQEALAALQQALGTDLNASPKLANLFRVRADMTHAIIDFGYAPPLLPQEAEILTREHVDVHTRLAIPYELAIQLIAQLQTTVDAARKVGAFVPGDAPAGPAAPSASPKIQGITHPKG